MKAPASKPKSSRPKPKASPAPKQQNQISPTEISTLQAGLTGGKPLPKTVRAKMEKSFGQNFKDVRIHTGGAADKATDRLNAEAFASGNHIVFGRGKFRPGTPAGDHLLAHELAHVVQQKGSGGAVQLKSLLSQPHESAEVAADRAADNVVSGKSAAMSSGGLSIRGRIMRKARRGSPTLSSAITITPNKPAARKPDGSRVLTPIMTSAISPAGGRLTDAETRRTAKRSSEAPKSKTPDESQTSISSGTGRAPKSVMVAGASAGETVKSNQASGSKDLTAKKKKGKDRDKEKTKEQAENQTETGKEAKEKGKKKTRKFGRNLGDRGAERADAARGRLGQRAAAMQVNEGASNRIGAARNAAAPPPNASAASGQRQQTETLCNAPIEAPDAAIAQQNARATISANAPSDLEELENFGDGQGQDSMANAIVAEAESQTGPVHESMGAIDTPPEGPAPDPAIPQPEPLAAPETVSPDLSDAAPTPVPEDSLDASEFGDEADSALAEYDVDDQTLEMADEGPLNAIGADRSSLTQKIDSASDRARGQETAARSQAQEQLRTSETSTEGAMAAQRTMSQTMVNMEQDTTRLGDEQGEKSLADQINSLYQTAQTTVNEKLGSLQTDAVNNFKEKQGARLEAFSKGVREDLARFKRLRYSGLGGPLRWTRDLFLSINSLPEVKSLYKKHKDQYVTDIDALMTEIKGDIQTTINDCKATLAQAKTDIDKLVDDNRGNLDDAAKAALARAESQFAMMASKINSTANATLRALDQERENAIKAMDQALAEIQAENAGLVDMIANAIKALADALGKFLAIMTRITRMGIGTFLGSAADQAKDGVKNHLWNQLKEAFKEWIFNKVPGLQLLMNLPPNWGEWIAILNTSLILQFMENLPAMLPAIGIAAMTWMATALLTKLIPGAGTIMLVIDGIRGAWALVQSLFTAATAFFDFVMKVAKPAAGPGIAFARALAHGIVAAVDAILTFLGVDKLIRKIIGTIARPFKKIFAKLGARFRRMRTRRRRRRQQRPRRRRQNQQSRNRRDSRRRDNRDDRRRRRKEEKKRKMEERFRKGIRAIKKRVKPKADGSVESPIMTKLWLVAIKLRYRFKTLKLVRTSDGYVIDAVMNPREKVASGVTINSKKVDPEMPKRLPEDPTNWKEFVVSSRGNNRLRAGDKDNTVRFSFKPGPKGKRHKGSWRKDPIKSNPIGEKGEKIVRQKLASEKQSYLSFINNGKGVNAPGLDEAGLRTKANETRFEIGEVKTSLNRGYHDIKKFSAITQNVTKNIESVVTGVASDGTMEGFKAAQKAITAIEAGLININIYLVGGARVSKPKKIKLRNNILHGLRKHLTKFHKFSKADSRKAVKNVKINFIKMAL